MMPHTVEISIDIIDKIKAVCGDTDLQVGDTGKYAHDETLDLVFPFDLVVKPSSPEEVASVLKICNAHGISITPRGGGSGVTGGALPVAKGVVLSLERLNKVLEINKADSYAVVESGVVTRTFCDAVEKEGLYFPIVPTSADMSFVGGNVSENAGSINSCKYGTTGDYVLNLEVVLPNGEIIWTGTNVEKDVAGLNITSLMVGSEGVLGVITKVVYRLIEKPKKEINLLLGFESIQAACRMVAHIPKAAIAPPSAVEYLGPEAIALCQKHFKEDFLLTQEVIKCHLLIQLEGKDDGDIYRQLEEIYSLAQGHTSHEMVVAQADAEKQAVWKIRKGLGAALTANNRKYRDIDITVPLSKIEQYIANVNTLAHQYQLEVIMFGHILDGNLHTMVIMDVDVDHKAMESAIRAIYSQAIHMGGTLSGEHGIGYLQKGLMPLQFPSAYLDLIKSIKHTFDPKGILNPQKII